MTRIVIIDDDCNVREYMRIIIERTNGEFKIIGEAYDGLEGLTVIEELMPDILILDIEMPSINGIELLQELENKGITLRTLILSCHDEFQYVRQAMKLGAAEYLLKHKIDEKNILNTLRELKSKPISPIVTGKTDDNWQIKFRKFLEGELSYEQHSRISKQFANDDQTIVVCALQIDYLKKYTRMNGEYKGKILEEKVWNTLNNIKLTGFHPFFLKLEAGFYPLLLVFDYYTPSSSKIRSDIYQLAHCYIQSISESCYVDISIGISAPMKGMSHIHKQWNDAQAALAQKFYYGYGQSIFYEEIDRCIWNQDILNELKIIKTELLPREELISKVTKWFREIDIAHIPMQQFHEFFDDLLNYLIQTISHLNIEMNSIFGQMDFITVVLDSLETLEDYKNWILEVTNKIYDVKKEQQELFMRAEIVQALKYIDSHYMDNISLEEISGYVGMSKTYFSNVFKNETGQKFSLYLLKYRLEKSKELLLLNKEKGLDIAYSVGFHSHTYFFNAFKKEYGITPKEYRKKYLE